MVAITMAKMLKLLRSSKTDTDLKVKYTSFRLCDSFLSKNSTVMIKASLALVIRLSLTFRHGTDKARMNRS